MELKNLQVLIVDDDIFKASDIKKALERNGILHIISVETQEEVWEEINKNNKIDLIVTDMHYPLKRFGKEEAEAGFLLIQKLKDKGLDIPVIICSSQNYKSKEALGSVWYNELRDIQLDFKEILKRL